MAWCLIELMAACTDRIDSAAIMVRDGSLIIVLKAVTLLRLYRRIGARSRDTFVLCNLLGLQRNFVD